METTELQTKTTLQRLWALGCSLKLAIALASVATILIMGGSLVMHYNPRIFSGMEQETMGIWLPWAWAKAPQLTWWVPLSGLCVILFAINTLCCLIDWLFKIKARWRKTGEYLIHAGFILLVIAYTWGSISGFRSGPHRIFPGERLTIPDMPAYAVQLDGFSPKIGPSGRPLDMLNEVSLWKEDNKVARTEVRINHPLIYDGLIILSSSFGQELQGFRFFMRSKGLVDLTGGSKIPISETTALVVHKLLPDARRNSRGSVVQIGERLNNPAMLVALQDNGVTTWEGWYFLRNRPPAELSRPDISIRPVEPIYKTFSLLTINRDPGDKLALLGIVCITVGVIFAFFSFYRKRAIGDRPEV